MAFRKYAQQDTEYGPLVAAQPRGGGESSSGNEPWRYGTEGVKLMKERFDQYNDRISQADKLVSMQKDQEEMHRKRQDDLMVENVIAATFGESGARPGQTTQEKLNEELRNPAAPMTEAEAKFRGPVPGDKRTSSYPGPMTLEMIKERAHGRQSADAAMERTQFEEAGRDRRFRERQGAASQGGKRKEAAIAFLKSFTPGEKVQSGKDEITVDKNMMLRSLAMKFPNERIESDPEIQAQLKRFDQMPEQKPSFFSREFWMGRPGARAKPTTIPSLAPEESENPYAAEYPDAFLEDGVWKVERDGQKFRIQD